MNSAGSFTTFRFMKLSGPTFFLILFGFAVLVRVHSLLPGFALDDYVHQQKTDPTTYNLLEMQGRWGSILLSWFLDSLNVPLSSTYVFGSVFLSLALSGILTCAVKLMRFSFSYVNLGLAAVVISSTYQTEIYTFRSAILNVSISFLLTLLTIWIIQFVRSPKISIISAIVTVGVALSFYQSILNYLIIIGVHSAVVIRKTEANNWQAGRLNRPTNLLIATVSGTLLYFFFTKLLQTSLKISADPRSSFIPAEAIQNRLLEWAGLIVRVLFLEEPIAPQSFKVFAFILSFAVAVIGALSMTSKKETKTYFTTIVILSLSTISMIPGVILLLQNWWPMPRVIAHLAFGFGFCAMFIISNVPRQVQRTSLVFLALLTLSMSLKTQSMFIDQQKLNRIDGEVASAIAATVSESVGSDLFPTVTIVGGFYSHTNSSVSTMQGDLNMSAFGATFSKYPLVFGKFSTPPKLPTVIQEDEAAAECSAHPLWPTTGSVFKSKDQVIVCLSR